MVSINFSSLGKINSQHGCSKEELNFDTDEISRFLINIANRYQGFYECIDEVNFSKINNYSEGVSGKYLYIVVLGIGGSALGTICLDQALKHIYSKEIDQYPKLYVLDNIDPTLINEIQDVIDLEKTLFIVVTKSGSTPETLSQYSYFVNLISEQNHTISDHFVFITDPKDNILRKIASQNNIAVFDIPLNVGGRFSVLTSVGLLPAKLCGLDIDQLLNGARSMRDKFLSKDVDQNLSYQLAKIQFVLNSKGKTMNVMLPYYQKLIKFADWYRQLLAESIGKSKNNDGEVVNVGITPVNALGVTDQHSQSQLYNEGPNDKLFIFFEVAQNVDIPIPSVINDDSMNFLRGVTFGKLLKTEMEATTISLTSNDRPNVSIYLDKLGAYELGELFMLFEGAIAFLGEMYEINAFNQPGVELSKIHTKELLLKNQ